MKKFLNKKTLAAAILAVALVVAGLGTYAFWIIDITPETDIPSPTMGVLDYEVIEGPIDNDSLVPGPGSNWSDDLVLQPTKWNTLPFVAKVPMSAGTITTIKNAPTLYPDAGWNVVSYKTNPANYLRYKYLPELDWWTIPDSEFVEAGFDEKYIGFGGTIADNFAWFYDDVNDNDIRDDGEAYYIGVWGNPEFSYERFDVGLDDVVVDKMKGVQAVYKASIDEDLPIMYMGATIEVGTNTTWSATQLARSAVNAWLPGLFDRWKVVQNDLQLNPPWLRSASVNVTIEQILAQLEAAAAQ